MTFHTNKALVIFLLLLVNIAASTTTTTPPPLFFEPSPSNSPHATSTCTSLAEESDFVEHCTQVAISSSVAVTTTTASSTTTTTTTWSSSLSLRFFKNGDLFLLEQQPSHGGGGYALRGFDSDLILGDAVFVLGKSSQHITGGVSYTDGFWTLQACDDGSCDVLYFMNSTKAGGFEEDAPEEDDHGSHTSGRRRRLRSMMSSSPQARRSLQDQGNPDGDFMCDRGVLSDDKRYCCAPSCDGVCESSIPADPMLLVNINCAPSAQSSLNRSCLYFEAPCDMRVVQKILITYTQATLDALGSVAAVQDRVDLALTRSNQAFDNSKVPIQYELFDMYLDTSLTDTTAISGSQHLVDLRDSTEAVNRAAIGGFDWHILFYRFSSLSGLCGQAITLDCQDPSCIYGIVQYNCVNLETFIHEVMHLTGCSHNPANGGGDGSGLGIGRFPYGTGYVIRTSPSITRTIMAVNAVGGARRNYLSSPDTIVDSLPGGVATQDNARVAMFTRYEHCQVDQFPNKGGDENDAPPVEATPGPTASSTELLVISNYCFHGFEETLHQTFGYRHPSSTTVCDSVGTTRVPYVSYILRAEDLQARATELVDISVEAEDNGCFDGIQVTIRDLEGFDAEDICSMNGPDSFYVGSRVTAGNIFAGYEIKETFALPSDRSYLVLVTPTEEEDDVALTCCFSMRIDESSPTATSSPHRSPLTCGEHYVGTNFGWGWGGK